MATILVIEDDPAIRNLLADVISDLGHTPPPVASSAEGILHAQARKPPVAFIDVQLPGSINGYEACRKLRETAGTTDSYIIILTGRRGQEAIASAKEAGANAFLRKPFRQSEVEEVIRRGLKAVESGE